MKTARRGIQRAAVCRRIDMKVAPGERSNKAVRYQSEHDLYAALRLWAWERMKVPSLGEQCSLKASARRVAWLRAHVREYIPRTNQQAASLALSEAIRALDKISAWEGTQQRFVQQVLVRESAALAAEMRRELADVEFLLARSGVGNRGRHGWQSTTSFVAAMQLYSLDRDRLVAASIVAKVVKVTDFKDLVRSAKRDGKRGPTLADGCDLVAKRLKKAAVRLRHK